MVTYKLLTEMTHELLTNKQLFIALSDKLPEEFFGDHKVLYDIYIAGNKGWKDTQSLPSVGYLEDALYVMTNIQNNNLLFDIQEYRMAIADIFKTEYDPEFIKIRIYREMEIVKLFSMVENMVAAISDGQELEVDKIIEECQSLKSELSNITFQFKEDERATSLEDLTDFLASDSHIDSYIPTGWAEVDADLRGLSREGEVGVIIAPPNRGKTALLGALTRNMVMKGYNVLFISGETHSDILRRRFWAAATHSNLNKMNAIEEDILEKALLGFKRVGGQLFFEDFIDDPYFSPRSLEDLLTKYIDKYNNIDCVVLDYFDLMLPNGNSKDFRLALGAIYKDVRRIAIKYKVPIWTASQTNRVGASIPLITEMAIGEDFQKAANADKILSFNQLPSEYEDKIGRLFVMKTRGTAGKNNVYELFTEFEKMNFEIIRKIGFEEHQEILENLRSAGKKDKNEN